MKRATLSFVSCTPVHSLNVPGVPLYSNHSSTVPFPNMSRATDSTAAFVPRCLWTSSAFLTSSRFTSSVLSDFGANQSISSSQARASMKSSGSSSITPQSEHNTTFSAISLIRGSSVRHIATSSISPCMKRGSSFSISQSFNLILQPPHGSP